MADMPHQPELPYDPERSDKPRHDDPDRVPRKLFANDPHEEAPQAPILERDYGSAIDTRIERAFTQFPQPPAKADQPAPGEAVTMREAIRKHQEES